MTPCEKGSSDRALAGAKFHVRLVRLAPTPKTELPSTAPFDLRSHKRYCFHSSFAMRGCLHEASVVETQSFLQIAHVYLVYTQALQHWNLRILVLTRVAWSLSIAEEQDIAGTGACFDQTWQ